MKKMTLAEQIETARLQYLLEKGFIKSFSDVKEYPPGSGVVHSKYVVDNIKRMDISEDVGFNFDIKP